MESHKEGPGVPLFMWGLSEKPVESSGPTERLIEVLGVLEDSVRALGCKERQKESFGVH